MHGEHFARSRVENFTRRGAAPRKLSELGARGVFASLFDLRACSPKSDARTRTHSKSPATAGRNKYDPRFIPFNLCLFVRQLPDSSLIALRRTRRAGTPSGGRGARKAEREIANQSAGRIFTRLRSPQRPSAWLASRRSFPNSLFLRANLETGTTIRNVAPRTAAPADGNSATTATSSGRPRLCDCQGGFYLRTKDVPGAGGLRGFCHS